ncbi:MAG TPA: PIN domain-containing protein, partial [Lamprocystis sp. (in: g-proteobacteria)]|nr:PIN domain-containing protein [Lamprocystis sp. (in: g-proteobacteria)]
ETEAILGVLAWCEADHAQLLSSVALRYELNHNPHSMRKAFPEETLSKSVLAIAASNAAQERARGYSAGGIKALDALHLACAIAACADYFWTCDDRFLRRAKQVATGATRAVTPLELIRLIGQRHDIPRSLEKPQIVREGIGPAAFAAGRLSEYPEPL